MGKIIRIVPSLPAQAIGAKGRHEEMERHKNKFEDWFRREVKRKRHRTIDSKRF